jgi:hypothetical protein
MDPVLSMSLLWIAFAGLHIGATTERPRAALVARYGERGFTNRFSLVAAVLFSAIEPIDNSIIFFRSRSAAHEITKVRCPSDDFGDGRFTLNGWVHLADEG